MVAPRRSRRRLLALADALWALTVATPLVVCVWRGLWQLLDLHAVAPLPSFLLALAATSSLALAQDSLSDACPAAERTRPAFLLASRLYTALHGACCVLQWRGGWALLDATGLHAGGVALLCYALLLGARAAKNSLFAPVFVFADLPQGFFRVSTLFRTKRSVHGALWVLDCLFSVLVVGNLVVFVWRGAWTMLDLYLYPDHEAWSAFASLVLGYCVVVASFCLQLPLFLLVGKLQGLCRLLVADVYHTVAFFGTVNVWRGIWNLLNLFLLPGNPELSYWSSLVVSMAVLMLLGCANSILVRGVFIDGEEPGGRCVIFPYRYFRAFCKKNPKKKDGKRPAEEMAIAGNHVVVSGNVTELPETIL